MRNGVKDWTVEAADDQNRSVKADRRRSSAALIALAGAVVCVLGPAGMAAAQIADSSARSAKDAARSPSPTVVRVDEHVILRAILGKQAPGDELDCVQTISHSDFSNYQNPVGQSVVVQAGFAQNEATAQTYTVPASSFPIKINTIETIFATANSNTATTTRWSVIIWEGTPQSGTVVATYSSDGDVLPHLELPPGNAAGIIQFGVDPTHPEQIIIHNDGTNSFSVGFRIDQHNLQTGNPCTEGPPTCCNAFPATDTSGLNSPTGNWLFGLDCGPQGCPPNGGWSTFGNLQSLCRPTGDWILRANWQPLSCTPGIGACCLPNGSCEVTTATNCAGQNGTYRGDGADCASANCPQPTGACCFANGNCLNLSDANCATAQGTWLGSGTSCNNGACPTGACCLPSGQCTGNLTTTECTAQNGIFQGVGSQCSGTNCPQPSGACCTPSGGCLELTQVDCGQIPSANWAGAFTTCSPQACCYANCTGSTSAPILTVDDFTCFINAFASAQGLTPQEQVEHYANCDGSTTEPVLTVDDFTCFINKFAAGCP